MMYSRTFEYNETGVHFGSSIANAIYLEIF